MRITDVNTLPGDAALPDALFVKVEADEGMHGWGAAAAMFLRTFCPTPLSGCAIGARPAARRR